MTRLLPVLSGTTAPGRRDLTALLYRKVDHLVARAQSDTRRLALARCHTRRLARMLAIHMPPGFAYLNIGHSNRRAPLWQAVRYGGAERVLAMLHDTIPLDFPQFSREGLAARFEAELRATIAGSDGLICNSAATKARAEFWLQKWGLSAPLHVALLGCDPLPRPAALPMPSGPPEFVILGTIEPRKNHALLLDVWARMVNEPKTPHLHIIGRRGWRNDAVFARLDHDPIMGRSVFEHGPLDDAALGARLARARALLFPTFAEGFGYPLVEALQMGIPVICSDLPVFRSLAGPAATYLPPDDTGAWLDAIRQCSQIPPERPPEIDFPSWDSHFSFIDNLCA